MTRLQVGTEPSWSSLVLVLALLPCLVYLGVGLRVLREEPMGKNRVAQFYGYSVCLVAVIGLLGSTGALAGALLQWSDPLHVVEVNMPYPPRSLASFETYKMDVLNPPYGGPQPRELQYVPDDPTLRRMYEAARAERLAGGGATIRQAVVTNTIVLLLCLVLFWIHWRWLRKLATTTETV